jgi:rare lipoprotein A
MWKRKTVAVAALIAALAAAGCAKKRRAPAAPSRPAAGWTEEGVASWYGHPYHGRKAANGETYDMEKMTAAHRTLPFGAMVRVENRENGRWVEVRVTDRGPFVDDRVIDLSRAAAEAIGMIGPGTARVKLKLIGYGPARAQEEGHEGGYAVQAGAFSRRENAEALKERMERQYHPVRVVEREGLKAPWRVLIGEKRTEEEARSLAERVRKEAGTDALVVRLDPAKQ